MSTLLRSLKSDSVHSDNLGMKNKKGHELILNRMAFLIHAERSVRGLTQQEVADRLKMTQGAYSKLENGEAAPNVIHWLSFCELFKLPASIPYDDVRYMRRVKEIEKLGAKFNTLVPGRRAA